MHSLFLKRLTDRLNNEQGLAMVLVMGVLLAATILGVAALSAAQGDILQSADARDRKEAYAAAEAGVAWYQAKLSADPNYWTKCANTGDPTAPVNNEWNGTKVITAQHPDGDPRTWKTLTGTKAEYTIELIPAPTKTSCSQSTMIDDSGSFRIRATGRFGGEKRSIIARFARKRFLDYIYFTDFETTDPLAYPSASQANASTYCGAAGKYRLQRNATSGTFQCLEIQFAQADVLRGPVHSNDSFYVCNNSTFGELSTDVIESSQDPGNYYACTNGVEPNWVGAYTEGVDPLPMPTSNDSLKAKADLVLLGTNILNFNGSSLTVQKVTGTAGNLSIGAPVATTWPANGLIYVDSDGACAGDIPLEQDYDEAAACANVYVNGNYGKDVTIASAKDIIVRGSFTQTAASDSMAGLIATNFVRVYHPVSSHNAAGNCSGTNNPTSPAPKFGAAPTTGVTIEAAILSLAHGFTVDSYNCGAKVGTLNVTGAIAQKFRGAVGTGGTTGTGYLKNYVYDRRMKYRNPPLFLDPVGARWRILRSNEQIPAR